MALNSDDLFDILDNCDREKEEAEKAKATAKASEAALRTLLADSDEDDHGSCVGSAPPQTSTGAAPVAQGKRKASSRPSSKSTGKFQERIRRDLVPTKNGKMKNVARGQDPRVVPMDDSRMKKIALLMAKNREFSDGVNMNDINVMVDHFTVLMILKDAYLNNGHGKGDKYPRHLRVFFGPGGFTRQDEVVESNKGRAKDIALRHVRENVIHTQNIKIAGEKVNAMQAPEKQRDDHINKLANNIMFGFNVYAQLLLDVREGRLRLPDTRQHTGTPAGLSASSCAGSSSDLQAVQEAPAKRFKAICDPSSPCASGNESE